MKEDNCTGKPSSKQLKTKAADKRHRTNKKIGKSTGVFFPGFGHTCVKRKHGDRAARAPEACRSR